MIPISFRWIDLEVIHVGYWWAVGLSGMYIYYDVCIVGVCLLTVVKLGQIERERERNC